jgi:hypothetical protein
MDPHAVFIGMIDPRIAINTAEITAIGTCGIGGSTVETGAVYYTKGGTTSREAIGASKHLKIAISDGYLYPISLTAQTGEPAVLSFGLICLSDDGVTNPLTISANQTMPATGVTTEHYMLADVSINGTTYETGSVSVDFGLDVKVRHQDGYQWAQKVASGGIEVVARTPTITFDSPECDLLSTLGSTGAAQGATDSLIRFRKCNANGSRVADATEEHVTIAIDDGRIMPTSTDAGDGGMGSHQVTIQPVWDGTNAILVIDTTAALT